MSAATAAAGIEYIKSPAYGGKKLGSSGAAGAAGRGQCLHGCRAELSWVEPDCWSHDFLRQVASTVGSRSGKN